MTIESLIGALWLALASPPEPAPEALGPVTTLELEGEDGQQLADELARLQVDAPGLAIASPGGLGRFSAVSLRRPGSLAIPIFVDGAPLTDGAPLADSVLGPTDLASLPLENFARVELHRGRAPLRYGSAALGGAVDLVGDLHRGPARLWAQAGVGSFRTRALRAGFAVPLRPRLSLAGHVDYGGSQGNFSHYDDGGTPLAFGDDLVRRRASNDYDRAGASLRLDHRRGPVQASTLVFARWQLAGVPAPNRARPSDASLHGISLRSISRVRRSIVGPGGYLEWVASVGGEGRLFRDREAVLGSIADDERTRSVDAWLSPRMRLPVWRQGWLSILGDARGEWIDVRDRASELDPAQLGSGEARRRRVIAGVGAELEQLLYDRRWAIAPGLRVDLVANEFAVPDNEGEADDRGRDRMVLGISPRIATTFALREGLVIHGSAGRTLRPPTLLELFGDRGVMAGNEGLRVETSTKVDGGVRFELDDLGGRSIDLLAQVTGFVAWSSDAIHWVRDEGVLRPVNVDRARIRGIELGASLRAFAGDLAFDLAYTLVDGRNTSDEFGLRGLVLPGLAHHNLLLRPSGGHRFAPTHRRRVSLEPRLSHELEYASHGFVDLRNRDMLPARLTHALGLSLRLADVVEFLVELRGLSHRHWAEVSPGGWPGSYPVAVSDAMGFALPGPSAWTSIRVDLRANPRRR
jgi:vitamin B12 transporter